MPNRLVLSCLHPLRLLLLAVALVMVLPAAHWTARAQSADATASGEGLTGEQRRKLEEFDRSVGEIERRMDASAESDTELAEFKLELDRIGRDLISSGLAFRPRLAEINERLEQLGSAPGEGQPPEPDVVAKERQDLLSEKAEINALLGTAESISVRVKALSTRASQLRRDLFARLLTQRYALDDTLEEVFQAYFAESSALHRTLLAWAGFVIQFKMAALATACLLAFVVAVPLTLLRKRFDRLVRADPAIEAPGYLTRLSVAFWSTLIPSLSVWLTLAVVYLVLQYFDILRGDVGAMVMALFYVIALVFFVTRLARAVLVPPLPQWRLVPVESGAARWLFWLVTAMAVINGIDYFFNAIFEVRGAPLALTVAESLVATVLIGILVVLLGFARPFLNAEGAPRHWPRSVKYGLVALGLVTVAAALLGYVGLARFISRQIVITGAILSTMYIGFLTAGAVGEEGALGRSSWGGRLQRRTGINDAALDQVGLASGIVLYLIVGLVGIPLILLQWGFQWGDIQSWAYALGTGVRIGNVNLSLTGLLGGVIVFVVGFLLTRWFSRWLDVTIMARGRVDTGVRNSIRTVVGYAGILLAALFGISAAGIDLSSFALVAGGLSLGIGFGLQNVVSNFVSGLILLAERPFKVGDWVVAGQVQGTVRKISVRATEIETFQRQTLIVPNSEFINSAVGNWTHRNRLGRVDIKVVVAGDSDPRMVHALLLEAAKAHPLVLRNPEPFVAFTDFGQAGLTFEVRVFLADILTGGSVQNDLRFSILETLRREKVAITVAPAPVAVQAGSGAPGNAGQAAG